MDERLGAALQITVRRHHLCGPELTVSPPRATHGHPGAGPSRPAGSAGTRGRRARGARRQPPFIRPPPGPSPHARDRPRRPAARGLPTPGLCTPGGLSPHPGRGWRGAHRPRPWAPRPGRASARAPGRRRGARARPGPPPSPGTRQPRRAPPASAPEEREGEASQTPLPGSPPPQESPRAPPPGASPIGVVVPGQPRAGPMRRRGRHPHTHPPSPPPQLFTSQSLQPTGRRHLGRTAPPPA